MPSHPADRSHRRLLDRKHRPYDGDRHLIRSMQAAMNAMYAADRAALDQEWDAAATFSPTGYVIAMQAGRWLATL